MISEKLCRRCQTVRSSSEFRLRPRSGDGLDSWCKSCCAEYQKAWVDRRPGYHGKRYRRLNPLVEKTCHGCGATFLPTRNDQKACSAACVSRAKHLASYGLSLDEFTDMLARQDMLCAICNRVMDPAVIDHCHETGEVRGLLCTSCNPGLGLFGDDPDRLAAAIDYLARTRLRLVS